MPQVPEGVAFQLCKIESVAMPHPYCITPMHVAYAADKCCGMLDADAIRNAEKFRGACCDTCRHRGENLSYDEHENLVTLFIEVPTHELNSVAGLHTYLFNNKAEFESKGIQGFAFPLTSRRS